MFEKVLENKHLLIEETLLSTANGYIGVRGNFEEGYKEDYQTIRGTYINGFHEIVDITYGESAYGFPKEAQRMLNVTDVQGIELFIVGEKFSLFDGTVMSYNRSLNIEKGYASREIIWKSPKGNKVKIEINRMTSFDVLELFSIEYKVTPLNFNGKIQVISTLEGDVTNFFDTSDPRVASEKEHLLFLDDRSIKEDVVQLKSSVKRASESMVVSVSHNKKMDYEMMASRVVGSFESIISENETLDFVQLAVFTDSIRHKEPQNVGLKILKSVKEKGLKYFYQAQESYLNEFWKSAKIEIEGEALVEEGLNYNTYQLLSSVGKDEHSNVCAKGLSGEGYEGHYFWDTEIYVLPFFTLNRPELAKNLLKFRHTILDDSRKRALELGHSKGAKIPWRTISGKECSGYFPAGTAQYHINADVAYSNIQYYLFSGDLSYIAEYGLEILIETARLWMEVGHFFEDEFLIDAVTGPDEYTAVVNNNYYTNAMAKYHLHWTVEIAAKIEGKFPDRWKELVALLKIEKDELSSMFLASEKMRLPFAPQLNIHMQDDSFLKKKRWDFENTPKDKYPLLLHFHPLTIYRHQVLKQADVVLADLLLDEAPLDVIKDSYAYYEALTTHDSSLSPAVYSMMASRIGNVEKAYSYFKKTVRLDLDNLHGNTKDGLHIANAGGAYMTVVYGFAGLRIKSDGIHIRPMKPEAWKSYTFKLNYEGCVVSICVGDQIVVTSEKEIEMTINDQKYVISGQMEV